MTIKIPCVPFTLHIGQAGESGFRPIAIDWSAWQTEYPNGTLSIIIARPDGETFPSVVGITDSPYTYTPTALDTEIAGNGSMEFVLSDGDTIGKTLTFPIVINESLTAGEVPTPTPTWMQEVFEASGKAVEAVSHYPYIGTNGNWLVWDVENEEFTDTGLPASGITDVSSTFTPNLITYSVQKLYRIGGRLVAMTLKGTNATSAGFSNAMIGTLSAVSRPATNGLTMLCFIDGTASTVSISGSGQIICPANIAKNAIVEITGIYAI